jgi:hypothetical protein
MDDSRETPSPRRQKIFEIWILVVLTLAWIHSVGYTSSSYMAMESVVPGLAPFRKAFGTLFFRRSVYEEQ